MQRNDNENADLKLSKAYRQTNKQKPNNTIITTAEVILSYFILYEKKKTELH